MRLRAIVEKETGIRVLHLNQTADFTDHLEEFETMTEADVTSEDYHFYKCKKCKTKFGVSQELEDHSDIACPKCLTEEVDDDGSDKTYKSEKANVCGGF